MLFYKTFTSFTEWRPEDERTFNTYQEALRDYFYRLRLPGTLKVELYEVLKSDSGREIMGRVRSSYREDI